MRESKMQSPESQDQTTVRRPHRVFRLSLSPSEQPLSVIEETCEIVGESLVSIEITEVGRFYLFCTPSDQLALGAGFTYAEGMIDDRADIHMLTCCQDDPSAVRMQIADPDRAKNTDRNLTILSSCGMCGFLRNDRISIYTHPHRIVDLDRGERACTAGSAGHP